MKEHYFTCPYCWKNISMVLDASSEGQSSYVEDCENCCHPILIAFSAEGGDITAFEASRAQ